MRLATSLCLFLFINSVLYIPTFVAADSKLQKDASDDLKLLQGSWKVVALEDDGMKAPPEVLKGARWVFKGSEVQVAEPGEELHDKSVVKLDLSKTPKHIDLIGLGIPTRDKTWLGIYKIEKDRLVVCTGETETAERPTDFNTGPDSHRCMITLERVKD
jgi:uncharacterized protein (TIGR03067 family)